MKSMILLVANIHFTDREQGKPLPENVKKRKISDVLFQYIFRAFLRTRYGIDCFAKNSGTISA
ncbi:MAG: hypothetical protein U9Q87_13850 [Pseudomonadota bacterium]|nr:hypothetical protein [Pseudomonadota bacterium]